MRTASAPLWRVRLVTLLLAALAAGSAVFWALKWSNQSAPAAPTASAGGADNTNTQSIALLLGAQSSAPAPKAQVLAQATYKLLGVISVGRQGQGSALISQQGKPAKPVRVGDEVGEGLMLQSVHPRRVELGSDLNSPPSITLELPLRAGQT
jgi:general secretion pathway protein C